jgi:hypothetical protein
MIRVNRQIKCSKSCGAGSSPSSTGSFFENYTYLWNQRCNSRVASQIHLVKLDSCFQDLSMLCAKYQSSGIAGSHNMWFNWMNTLSSSLSSLLNSLQFFLDFIQSRFIIESFIFGNSAELQVKFIWSNWIPVFKIYQCYVPNINLLALLVHKKIFKY